MPKQRENIEPSAKPIKLRESCDSCLAAKVKCSKSRPLCSRCLANGAPCDYSPSSRAGKRNRNAAGQRSNGVQNDSKREPSLPNSSLAPDTAYLTSLMYPQLDGEDHALLSPSHGPNIDGISLPLPQHGSALKVSPNVDVNSLIPDVESVDSAEFLHTPPFGQADFFDPFSIISGSHQQGMGPFGSDPPSPNATTDLSNDSWLSKGNNYFRLPNFQSPLDMMPMGPPPTTQSGAQPFMSQVSSSFSKEPSLMREATGKSQSCDCFAVCLQVLQSLHNNSTMLSASHQECPPFDIVLSINREAIESCSSLLDCTGCVSRSGRSISTTMLATIFDKAMSLYRVTCSIRFGPSPNDVQSTAQLAFGAYMVTGENRKLLEIEILLLELKKFERALQLFAERFRDIQQAEKDDETAVYSASISYLEKNLQHVVEFLQTQKESAQDAA